MQRTILFVENHVRIAAVKRASVQCQQRRLIVEPRSWLKRVGYQQPWAAAVVEKFSEAYRNPFRYFIGAENQE